MLYDLSSFTADSTGSSNDGYAPLPEDRYTLKVEKATHRETRKAGSFVVDAQMVITEGEFKNRKVWNNFSTSPKAIRFIANVLNVSGGSKVIGSGNVSGDDLAAEMVGRTFTAMCVPGVTNTGKPVTNLDVLSVASAEEVTGNAGSVDTKALKPPKPSAGASAAMSAIDSLF